MLKNWRFAVFIVGTLLLIADIVVQYLNPAPGGTVRYFDGFETGNLDEWDEWNSETSQ